MIFKTRNRNKHPSIKIYSKPMFHATLIILPGEKQVNCQNVTFINDSATHKINPVNIMAFIDDLLLHLKKNTNVFNVKKFHEINLHDCYFAAESIRDIYSGLVEELTQNNDTTLSKKMVSFGFLAGKTKPQRQKYIDLCNRFDEFDYIKTKKFDRHNTKDFVSVQGLKTKYKYFIDLKGHTYSTKSLLFLASKRVFFFNKHPEELRWEKLHLAPWENYIPIKDDLSDLKKNYDIIESNPSLYKKIVTKNSLLIRNEISSRSMMLDLVNKICKLP